MSKRNLVILLAVAAVIVVIFIVTQKQGAQQEPLIFTVNSSLRELSIDDKISEAELILIGRINTTLPSKWKKQNEKDLKDATPQEIFEGGLFTDSIVLIDQIFKGDYSQPTIRVRSYIGETDQVRLVNSSEPMFEKGKVYLMFLGIDTGPTSVVDPGDYISINANDAIYEIIDDKAISGSEEWLLEELIAYIQQSLSVEMPLSTETPAALDLSTETPLPSTEMPTEIPLPAETATVTP